MMETGLQPKRTRISIIVLAIVLVVAVVELLSSFAFAIINGGVIYRRSPGQDDASVVESFAPPSLPNTILHPVLGFANRPGIRAGDLVGADRVRAMGNGETAPQWAAAQANRDGFFSSVEYPTTSADENEFLVGVFGGSLAQWMAVQAGDHLAANIEGLAGFEDRRVRVLSFAQGGFKYPQQIQALSFFASLGQRFDLVIDVSGFNELALGAFNDSRAVDAGWPSIMHLGPLTTLIDLESAPLDSVRLAARVQSDAIEVTELQGKVNESRVASFWLVRSLRLRVVEGRLESARHELARASAAVDSSLIVSRRIRRDPDLDRACHEAALQWRRGVSMMDGLAREMNALFVGVVQPNQYHSGHEFSPDERSRVLGKRPVFRNPVEIGYPLLGLLANELRDEGVVMINAVSVFDSEPRPVFSDDCCHLNELGNHLLVDGLMKELGPVLEARVNRNSGR